MQNITPFQLSICVDEINSTDVIIKRNALKDLKKNISIECHPKVSLSFLQSAFENGNPPLTTVLLDNIKSDRNPEICRELASESLKICCESFTKSREWLRHNAKECFLPNFYIEFCSVFHNRFSRRKENNNHEETLVVINNSPSESAEEIRLLLTQILSEILTCMKEHVFQYSGIRESLKLVVNEATSLLCESLSESAIRDPYPELNRESCLLLKKMTELFPSSIRMNSKTLLLPIIGCLSDTDVEGGEIKDRGRKTPISPSKHCLLAHKHSKMRCLALETSTSIILCHSFVKDCSGDLSCSSRVMNKTAPTSTQIERNVKSRLPLADALLDLVILNWEPIPLHERSVQVRLSLAKVCGKVLKFAFKEILIYKEERLDSKLLELEDINNNHRCCHARLLVLILMCASDDSPAVKDAAFQELKSVAEQWFSCNEERIAVQSDKCSTNNVRDHIQLVSILSPSIIPLILLEGKYASLEWKHRSFETMSTVIQMLNNKNDVSDETSCLFKASLMRSILKALCGSIFDEEKVVVNAAITCANSIGDNTYLAKFATNVLLEQLNNILSSIQVEHNSLIVEKNSYNISNQISAALYILAAIVRGSGNCEEWIGSKEAKEITDVLIKKQILRFIHTSKVSAHVLFEICHVMFKRTSPSLWTLTKENIAMVNIIYCCVHLLASPERFGMQPPTTVLLEDIASSLPNVDSMSTLLGEEFESLIFLVISELKNQSVSKEMSLDAIDPDLRSFDALLRNVHGAVLGENFKKIVPVLKVYLEVENDDRARKCFKSKVAIYERKLFVMALIESIISDKEFPKYCLHPFAEEILKSFLIPNLVWQVGGISSALRKVSAGTLFSILRSGGVAKRTMTLIAPKLLPVLKSNLQDDDTIIRELVCSSFGLIFDLLFEEITEEHVNTFYPDLLTCLDDSCDAVRFAGCKTLKCLIKSGHNGIFNSTTFEHIIKNLFIHMDDLDSEFQSTVLEVLILALDVDSSIVAKYLKDAETTHRSRQYCNALLQEMIGKTSYS